MPSPKHGINRWQLALALLFGVFLIGMATSMTLAARRASRVVDVDYYEHGLHYGQTGSGAKNAGLGWNMAAIFAGGELQVRVTDVSGKPVSGGKLRFEPELRGTARVATIELAESAPGLFRSQRPVLPHGELHGTLRFSRGEAAASHKLVLFD